MAPGRIEWRDVPAPTIQGPGEALIRPVVVARCDIDPFLILGGPATDEGFALGHEAVSEVVELGGAVTGVSVGQLVLTPFQVSCGTCPACRRGHTAVCETYPILSDYGMQPLSGVEYGGMLADLVRVPHARTMLVPLPPGIDPVEVASVPDNALDGYRAVAPYLAAEPGADVLVVVGGTPSIGLYAAQAALALGAGRVTVESDDRDVLALAEQLGARAAVTDFTQRSGRWPIVVHGGTRPEHLLHALSSTRAEGVLHSVSYPAEPTPLPLINLYTRGITFHIGRAHAAALLPEVVDLVAQRVLSPGAVTTRVVDWEDAPTAYLEPSIKLVVSRASRLDSETSPLEA